MRASFCPYCGLKLIKKEIGDEGLVPFCPKCNKPLFDHMIPCVIIVCYTTDNKIVLAHEPAKISNELESVRLVDYKEAQILLKEAKIASMVLNDFIKKMDN